MSKTEIAIIHSASQSDWQSCNSISANLRAAYLCLYKNEQAAWFEIDLARAAFDLHYGGGYWLEIAHAIFASDATTLAFIDHEFEFTPLLAALKIIDPRRFARLRFVFHVYGDFLIFGYRWQEISELLERCHVTLICASERQRQLVRSFERSPTNTVTAVCPFAVHTDFFKFSEKKRQLARKRLGIAPEQHVSLYTGRISLQKGIILMLQEFVKLRSHRANSVLLIAGGFDDIGGPTTGLDLRAGFFYQSVQAALNKIAPKIAKDIHFLGSLDTAELSSIYFAADAFISLSLYHDEDFGMAPAEALSSGLPCLLSDWGGYGAFAVDGVACHLIPVTLSDRGLSFEQNRIQNEWLTIAKKTTSSAQRLQAGRAFAKHFSIESVSRQLRQILSAESRRFSGFNWRLQSIYQLRKPKSGLYQEVYAHYVTPHPKQGTP